MSLQINPTKGERFKAMRRRDGLNKEQCAKKLGLTSLTIRCWEQDTPSTPNIKINLTKGEKYFIIRERLGMTLKGAAELIGVSHVTLINMEKAEKGEIVLEDFYKKYIRKNKINL